MNRLAAVEDLDPVTQRRQPTKVTRSAGSGFSSQIQPIKLPVSLRPFRLSRDSWFGQQIESCSLRRELNRGLPDYGGVQFARSKWIAATGF